MSKIELQEIFDEAIRPKRPPKATADSVELTKKQLTTLREYRHTLGAIYGITLDEVRYITNGHLLIAAPAIVSTDEWGVFKALFKALGDTWQIADTWARTARVFPAPTVEQAADVRKAIESWDEDSVGMTELVAVRGCILLQNRNGKLIAVDLDYYRFILSHLGFNLDDVAAPDAPIPMTHRQSLGFGGILMPMVPNITARGEMITMCRQALSLLESPEVRHA